MPEAKSIVINTSPLISLVAGLGDLDVLQQLFDRVLVPLEVCQEIQTGRFAAAEFEAANWLEKWPTSLAISPLLINSLDQGEAAVIQLALDEQISTVCIDESAGRRIARLSGLLLTGSIGILIKAKRAGYPFSMFTAIERMQQRGIRLSQAVIDFALEQAEETE